MARLGTVSMVGLRFVLDPAVPPGTVVCVVGGKDGETEVETAEPKGSSAVCAACKGIARIGKHRDDAACRVCGGRGWIVR